jgi:hypothetical protein
MKIRFFCGFADSKGCKDVYERLCQTSLIKEYGENNEIYLTNEEDYTHAIIMSTAMPPLKIPKERVIGLAFEPPQFLGITRTFIEYAQRHIGKYFIGQLYGLPSPPFIEDYSYMWHVTPIYDTVPSKTKFMSIICSEKMNAPGHKYRHQLVAEILKMDLPIDIYGRGAIYYTQPGIKDDPRICGKFDDYEPYTDYQYTIAIENYQTAAYISEKLTNPLLCGTNTLYWGAKNAQDKFGDQVLQILSGDLQKDMDLIRKICVNREPATLVDISQIKDKMNLIRNIKRLFIE